MDAFIWLGVGAVLGVFMIWLSFFTSDWRM